jgi:sugar transferase (PEP-CTERM/EpsH1 system associated)
MRILYIAHRIPYPPNKGEKIRAFHHIRHLARRHSVHVACLIDDPADREQIDGLSKYCASVDAVDRHRRLGLVAALAALVAGTSMSVAPFRSERLQRAIERRLRSEPFDAIIVYSSSMADYVAEVRGIPRIMDFVDLDSEKWRLYAGHKRFPLSWVYRTEARRLLRHEVRIARAFEHSVFVSEREAAALRPRVGGRPISAIPNGVDLDYFDGSASGEAPPGEPTLVFTGVMDYFPNVDGVRWFCADVLPRVRQAVPDVRFLIVGRNPTRAVLELGRRPGVEVTGAVPDVRPYLRRASLGVVPLRIARGVQNKVLEAMAMGLPVVATGPAVEGIEPGPDDGVGAADDPRELARRIVDLLGDPARRADAARRAREFVEEHYRWSDHAGRMETLLDEVRRGHRPLAESVPV